MLKLLTGLLGVMIMAISFLLISWQVGYLALILFLLWLVRQMPAKWQRHLLLAYSVFVVTLISSTFLHTMWVRSEWVQQIIRKVSLLQVLAGSSIKLAFWALLAGLGIGLATAWAALQAILYVSSEFVLNLTSGLGISRQEAIRYLAGLVLERQLPSVIVEDGRVAVETPPGLLGRLGGPGLVIVRPGNAVVLESLAGASQILGPGTGRMNHFERIKQVVDLRPQEELVTVQGVLTKDRVPLTFHLHASFQIEPNADTDARARALAESREFEGVIEGTYPVYRESVFRAVYKVSKDGWRNETINALTAALRDVVFEYNLDELYDYPVTALAEGRYPGARSKEKSLVISTLEERVQAKSAAAAIAWGVKLNRVDVVTAEMPAEIQQMVLAWWQKKWETEIAKQDADKDATVLLKRAAGRRDALMFEGEGEAFAKAEGLRQVLQALSGDDRQWDVKSVLELLLQLVARKTGPFEEPLRIARESVIAALTGGMPGLPPAERAQHRDEGNEQEKKEHGSVQRQGQTVQQPPLKEE